MALRKLLLDTSAYSAFKGGNSVAVESLRWATTILIPAVVLGELLGGFEVGEQRDRNRRELDSFLDSPRVSIAPITRETAERYARIYLYLRSQGTPIPTNDLWIAAAAMEHSAELLTTDEHFRPLPQIIVRHFNG